ncbi:MAG TPA: TIGR02444 family protein [Brevundimonas sp.]|nr:TIGR02444 family protein [Brevundimonas sp.]
MSDLWTWAVAAYEAPGVAEACLSLQDHNEQNVPLLLWAAWVAVTGRRPDEETIEAACDAARAYDTVITAPLRAVRRTLKAPIPDIEDAHREALRQQVKALELDAERRLMLELEALAPAPSGAPRRAIDGLAETAKLWTRVVPRPALTTLADRLPA